MNDAIELIRCLSRERFYGAVTVKFEAGKVVCLKKEETIKPANRGNLSGNPRSEDGKNTNW